MKATALHFSRMGWEVFPLKPREKTPATSRGFKDASADSKQIEAWWGRNPSFNLGLPTGKNFVVLDADSEEAYHSVRALGTREPATVRTGKGWQWYFSPPSFPVRNSAGKVSRGIDIRGIGGYVVAPPSIHPNGKAYEWIEFPFRLLPFPQWLEVYTREKPRVQRADVMPMPMASNATKYGSRALRNQCSKVFCSVNGTRHATLASAAFSIGQLVGAGQIPKGEAYSELLSASLASGLEKTEAERTVRQCLKAGMSHPYFPKN